MRILFQGGTAMTLILLAALSVTTGSYSQSVSATAYPAIYYSGNPTIPVDPDITITSVTPVTNVRVRITQNFTSGDALSFTGSLPAGITSSYNADYGELVFTGTATAAEWQTLLRTVTFYTSSSVTDNRTVTFSIGNLVAGSNGHFYEYVPFGSVANVLTWTQSKDAAAATTYYGLQGYLATITSQEENDIIFLRLSASGWIGSTDDYQQINTATGAATYIDQAAAEGKWYWVTGPEAGTQFSESAWAGATPTPVNGMFVNWSPNEPNNNWNITQNGVTGEQYGEIYSGSSPWGQPGKWNDFYNLNSDMDFVQGYIIEYGGMPGDPAVSLAANRSIIFNSVLATANWKLQLSTVQQGCKLDWLVAANDNTGHFIIQHSTNGIQFTNKGTLAVSINSVAKNYSWVDYHPGTKANFYRVKMVNKDGSYTLSQTVSIVLTNANTAIWCFPNPVHQGANINLNIRSEKIQTATVALFTISGVRVHAIKTNLQAGTQYLSLNTGHIPLGTYLIRVLNENGNTIGAIQQVTVK